jgi:serine phosphatase RsbU (regulator of sigma subunit)
MSAASTISESFSPPDSAIPAVDRHLDELQEELDQLREEVGLLRRRDQTVHHHMQRLDEEMRLAARLQRDFLPKALPRIGPLCFHTLYRPAGYVSGDIYDVTRLDERHIGFFIADAVGHGMPAALLTMFLKRALTTKEIRPDGYRLIPPAEALRHLNTALLEQNLSHATFATALYGIIDIHTLSVTFARGGHPNPILLEHEGELRDIEADGGLLGIFPDGEFTETTLQLGSGDRLLLYTDGIEVAFTDAKTMDTEQWRSELHGRRKMATDAMLTDLVRHIDSHGGSLAPKDDLTMVVLDVAA